MVATTFNQQDEKGALVMNKMVLVLAKDGITETILQAIKECTGGHTESDLVVTFDRGTYYCMIERLAYETDHESLVEALNQIDGLKVLMALEPNKEGHHELLYCEEDSEESIWIVYNKAVEDIHKRRSTEQ